MCIVKRLDDVGRAGFVRHAAGWVETGSRRFITVVGEQRLVEDSAGVHNNKDAPLACVQ